MGLHGVNLAGWLSLESWVTPELFAEAGALNEPVLIRSLGSASYLKLVNEHRQSFIGESDFTLIAQRGFNACRVLVPWYVFGDAGIAPGPYVGCVDYVDAAFEWAEKNSLKLALALAIHPGFPTSDEVLARDPSDLSSEQEPLLNLIAALSKRYAGRDAFFGLELADSVKLDRMSIFGKTQGISANVLYRYYREAYLTVRECAGATPYVIFPDAQATARLSSFIRRQNMSHVLIEIEPPSSFTHVELSSPSGARHMVAAMEKRISAAKREGVECMVGKWSSSLPFADVATTPEGRIALERMYASSQIAAFESCEAWFFQTWKTSAHLSAWDARIALSSFEKGMLS